MLDRVCIKKKPYVLKKIIINYVTIMHAALCSAINLEQSPIQYLQ